MTRRLFILFATMFALMVAAVPASAAEVTMEWDWPTQYCGGEALPLSDLQQAEIYVSETTIPRVPTSCVAGDTDTPPPSAIVATVPTSDTTINIDLTCGKTYFFVMRVQAGGEWSNFSGEVSLAQLVKDILLRHG